MPFLRLAAAPLLVSFLLSGCTQTFVTPMAVAQPRRADTTTNQSEVAGQKTFFLPRDWQYNNWVMKKGTKITFYADGFGEFESVVFTHLTSSHDTIHFQAIQYGLDGNRLFTFPGADTGHPLHVRQSFQDHPQKARFAFDKRFYDSIHDCKFYARTRMKSENAGSTSPGTHSSTNTTFDMPLINP